jgi:hypothetical protein
LQVTELCVYLALLGDYTALAAGEAAAWKPLHILGATVLLPVLYSRRIVDWGASC